MSKDSIYTILEKRVFIEKIKESQVSITIINEGKLIATNEELYYVYGDGVVDTENAHEKMAQQHFKELVKEIKEQLKEDMKKEKIPSQISTYLKQKIQDYSKSSHLFTKEKIEETNKYLNNFLNS